MDICHICLRTDLWLKVVDRRLTDFHDELCDYSLEIEHPQYCSECEYLLRKLYKFKSKCVLAIEILQKWKKVKLEKRPLNLLYTQLPKRALGFWMPNQSTIFDYNEEPTPVSNVNPPTTKRVSNFTSSQVPMASIQKPGSNTLRGSVLNTNVKPVIVSNNILRIGSDLNIEVSKHVMSNKQVILEPAKSANVLSSQIRHKLPKKITVITDKNELIKNPIPVGEVKEETDCEDDLSVLNMEGVLKTEETTFEEIQQKNVFNNAYVSEKNGTQQQSEDDYETEYLDINSFNSDEDIETDNVKDVTIFKSDDDIETDNYVEDTILKSDDDIETDNYLDETILKSDDDIETDNYVDDIILKSDDDMETDCVKYETIIKSNDDMETNYVKYETIIKSDDDMEMDYDEVKENQNMSTRNKFRAISYNMPVSNDTELKKKYISKNNIKNKKLKKEQTNLKNNLGTLNENNVRIMIKSGKIFENVNYCNYKVNSSKQNVAMLRNMKEEMDVIQGTSEKSLKHEVKGALPFSIEQLVAHLGAICDELISLEGETMDRQYILDCILAGKVSQSLMSRLWAAIQCKEHLTKRATQILWCINYGYESVFDIDYLNTTEEQIEEVHRRKNYECYAKANYKCKLCFTWFQYEKHLQRHMKLHEVNAGNLLCTICGVRYNIRRYYKHHVINHQTVYKCKLCPLVTYNRATVINHYNSHRGVKYSCEPCDKTFRSISSYNTHCTYQHRRAHACVTCGRTFDTEDILRNHQKAHQVQPSADVCTSVWCEACGLTLPSPQVYERHARFTHGASPWEQHLQLKDTADDNSTKQKKNKSGSCRKNNGKKPARHTCPLCNASGSFGWLMLHGRLEHKQDLNVIYADKRTHLCDVCGKGFVRIYALRDHMNIHTGVRPYPCESCPKRFHSALKLYNHRQYHRPPTHFCTLCEKKFHSQSNLYTHMRSHIGNRCFKCEICDKGFLHSAARNEHVKGVHLHERRVKKKVGTKAGGGASKPGWRGDTTSTGAGTKLRKLQVVSIIRE